MEEKRSIVYDEFLIPVKDYFRTIRINEAIFDWGIPFIISVIIYFTLLIKTPMSKLLDINGYLINSLAILIGFSITTITILATSNNNNIKEIKNKYSPRTIDGKKISLYKLIFISYSFVLFMEFIAILYTLAYYLVYSSDYIALYSKVFFGLNIFIVLHIILLNIRNVVNFYLIHWKE